VEVSNLVGARRLGVAGLSALEALVAASGCHGGAAAGRRSDGGTEGDLCADPATADAGATPSICIYDKGV
jgi:hypothetical protein